ncbi:MAG: hypothetical protein HUU35_11840, partial [Armatimonadetes bacterium]|nr:hypothetical protein [Armatimonadota bacterium]
RGGERGQRQVRAGRPGARVATWRCRWQGGRLVAREKLSEDSYLPLGDLVRIKLPAATQVAP